jgi:hypothetical protein
MTDDFQRLAISFKRAKLAENRSPRTIQSYLEALGLFSHIQPSNVDTIAVELADEAEGALA